MSLSINVNVLVISKVNQSFSTHSKSTNNNVHKTIVDVEGKIRFGNLSNLV